MTTRDCFDILKAAFGEAWEPGTEEDAGWFDNASEYYCSEATARALLLASALAECERRPGWTVDFSIDVNEPHCGERDCELTTDRGPVYPFGHGEDALARLCAAIRQLLKEGADGR